MSESIIGVNINGYRLTKKIGEGGYGDVYAAEKAGSVFAVKVLSGSAAQREMRAFQLYFEKISGNHSFIVEPLDFGRWENGFYYVMPLADSLYEEGDATAISSDWWAPKSLYSLLRLREDRADTGWFSREEILAIAQNLFDAVGFLEQQGVLHRDIKPDNILFFGGKAYLSDMGVAEADSVSTKSLESHEFSAPDWYVASGGSPDIWGLATTLYMLTTGYLPSYIGRSFAKVPAALGEHLPDSEKEQYLHWHRCILRAIQSTPANRFVSLQDFKDAFLSADFAVSKFNLARDNKRPILKIAGLVVIGIAMVSGIIFFSTSSSHPEQETGTQVGHNRLTLVNGEVLPAYSGEPLVPVRTDKIPDYAVSFWRGGGWITQAQADSYVAAAKGYIVEYPQGRAFIPYEKEENVVPQVFIIDRTPDEKAMPKEMEAVIDVILEKRAIARRDAEFDAIIKKAEQQPHFLVDDTEPVILRSDKQPDYPMPMRGGWITRAQADEMLAAGRGRIVESSFGLSFVPNYNIRKHPWPKWVLVIDRTPNAEDMRSEITEVTRMEDKLIGDMRIAYSFKESQEREKAEAARKLKAKEAVAQ